MAVQTFNDRFLGNADVPNTGSKGGSQPPARGGSAVGMPKGVRKADGTENLGTTAVTKRANIPGPTYRMKDSRPKGVDTFSDAEV